MSGLVREDAEPPVGVLSLNRASRHNSLVPEMLDELVECLDRLCRRSDLGAVVLRAEGGSFSTGGDLQGFLDHWDDDIAGYADRVVGELNRAILALRASPLPVVAAVHGWVTGGSLGLLLGSDIVLVDETTRVAPFYCEVGFAPDGGWSVLLPGMIGERRAIGAQLTNETWHADELVSLGIANRRVVHADLEREARTTAALIAGKAGTTIRATKANRMAVEDWREPLAVEQRRFVETIQRPGVREGVQAFVEYTATQRKTGAGSD